MDEEERQTARAAFDRWMAAQTAHLPVTRPQGEMAPPTSLADGYIRDQATIARAAREQHGGVRAS